MSRASSIITSSFGRPSVLTVAPAWRLKLTRSKVSKSPTLKRPMPSRARVSRCRPPTPPRPAMATRLTRNASCSAGVSQPRLRENAASQSNVAILPNLTGRQRGNGDCESDARGIGVAHIQTATQGGDEASPAMVNFGGQADYLDSLDQPTKDNGQLCRSGGRACRYDQTSLVRRRGQAGLLIAESSIRSASPKLSTEFTLAQEWSKAN